MTRDTALTLRPITKPLDCELNPNKRLLIMKI